jgi:DNA adenine methylase
MDSPFAWPGGKRALKKVLLQLIPKHRAYVEVFAGSAKLLFAKEPSRWEVLNDVNDDLLNFFRVVKHRPSELAESMEREFVGKARFAELRAEYKMYIIPEMRSIAPCAFSISPGIPSAQGRALHRAHHRAVGENGASDPPLDLAVREVLQQTAGRLSNVLVDRRDFADCIDRYDSRDTFFYLDPPYTAFQPNGRYQPISEARLRELFAILKDVRGKFLLSFNDAKIVREAARGFCIRPVSVLYSLGANSGKKAPELLIANYPLKPVKT